MFKQKIEDLSDMALETRFARHVVSQLKNNALFRLIYREIDRIYAKKLLEEVKEFSIPQHVALIMDGNRRYALMQGLPAEQGHLMGKDKLEEMITWGNELKIRIITVFAFSTDNFKRKKEEVDQLMKLFEHDLRRLANEERLKEYGIRVQVIGELDLLPKNVKKAAEEAMEKTKHHGDYFLNIAIGYGGREEIIEAVKKIANDVQRGTINPDDINKKLLASYLYTSHLPIPDPDLILRTSGEERISNFLLWQLAYSELYFTDVYWPMFKQTDFLKAIRSYQQRQKRYGT